MESCPHCGGTEGYEGVLIARYQMTGSWGQDWETTGHQQDTRHKFSTCVDCGKRVRLEVACGAKDKKVKK